MSRNKDHDPVTELLLKSPWPLSIAEIAEATGFEDTTIVLVIRLMSQHGVVKQWTDGRWQLAARADEINARLAASEGSKMERVINIASIPPSTLDDRRHALDRAGSTPDSERRRHRQLRRH